MKVTSGKLQVGDVKHWKSGWKETITKKELDKMMNEVNADNIEWLLQPPTGVIKITRPNPWKETGRMLDEIRKAKICFWISGGIFQVLDDWGIPEFTVECRENFHVAVKKVYDRLKKGERL